MRRAAVVVMFALLACRREEPGATRDDPPRRKPSKEASSAVALELPSAAVGDEVAQTMRLDVDASGRVSLGGVAMKDDDELEKAASKLLASSADVRAVVRADKTVPYGRVMAVLDVLKKSGVKKIAFSVAAGASAP